ncbi:cytosolic carboxypeptidase 2-like isoform X2 [Brachyhypopomus gauderio]|uniref:cytosolic carboxypeptidase 2-like isoform X2 n=1 Tax=Brachyhypopomus gauderio TaxID=698409 RepID=UPI0040423A46
MRKNDMKTNKQATNIPPGYSASEEDDDDIEEDNHLKKTPVGFRGTSSLLRTTQVLFESLSGRVLPGLCEPRHLYGLSGDGAQGLPRWPQECEVIPEEVHHIEPLCSPVNARKSMENPEDNQVTLVYDAHQGQKCYFSRSCFNGNWRPLSRASVCLSGPDDTTLLFEGRFESGNLLRVLRVGEFDYELTLRPDLYTRKHTQWFYFQVKNVREGKRYRFTITNLLKSSSLYRKGQQPLLYSERLARARGVGWHRAGQDVSYYSNGRVYLGRPCYTLSWTLRFPFDQDVCYFAHCYPYTYTKLWSYLAELERDPRCSQFCKVRTLCRSLAGNLVPVVTITDPSRGAGAPCKPAVVLTARVHPGETNSSWVMKGLLDFLLSESPDAALLRDTFVFKLVPMLNPDGVIVGNSRCSLTGRDLNRHYRSKVRESFPSVWATWRLMQRLSEERKVLLYCDLHGHNSKHNVFTYGCESPRQRPGTPHQRVFPLMLHKNCPDMFSFPSCKFKVQRRKEGTGRVALWRLGVLNSFTLETSLCGSTMGQRKGTHFSTKDMEMLGTQFCDTLLDYCDPDRTKYNICVRELQDMLRQDVGQAVSAGPADVAKPSRPTDSPGGSISSGSDGEAVHLQARDEVKSQRNVFKSRKERNKFSRLKEKCGPNDTSLKILKTPLTKSERGPSKNQQKNVSSGRKAPISVLYLVFNTEKPATPSKSEYLQHLMSEYVRSQQQMQLKLKHLFSVNINVRSIDLLRCPSELCWSSLQDGRASEHTSAAQVPPRRERHLVDPDLLLGLTHPTTGDKTSSRLPPVLFRSSTSFTTESSLEDKTNSLTQHLHKCCLWRERGRGAAQRTKDSE